MHLPLNSSFRPYPCKFELTSSHEHFFFLARLAKIWQKLTTLYWQKTDCTVTKICKKDENIYFFAKKWLFLEILNLCAPTFKRKTTKTRFNDTEDELFFRIKTTYRIHLFFLLTSYKMKAYYNSKKGIQGRPK